MTHWEAFFTLHRDLPREGPGVPEDIAWAVQTLGIQPGARVLDAASGPGGDIPALLDIPAAHVTAIDTTGHFVEAVRDRFKDKVTAIHGSMIEDIEGPYDLIWCAGAVYFEGIETCLTRWQGALAPGGGVAFTDPCNLTGTPSEGAVAFWDGDPVQSDADARAAIAAAGYTVIADRVLSDAAWEAYYTPMEARIAALADHPAPEVQETLTNGRAEIKGWRNHRHEVGYRQYAVRLA
jgi:trans-aconitate methyltransferase